MGKKLMLVLFTAFLIAANSGCKTGNENHQALRDTLQNILTKHLAAYTNKFPGKTIGLGLYIKLKDKNNDSASDKSVYVSAGFPAAYGEAIQFRGASTTKSFTAAGILRLHQQGKLNIDDFITANIPGTNTPYIPATDNFSIPNKDSITIRLLLQHRAGVFDITNTPIPDTVNAPFSGQKYVDYIINQKGGENHTFTIPEMVNVVARNGLSYFKPGQSFHYSNTGYHLLAVILERISGKRYDQFMQDEFLTPLQLKHTNFPYLGEDQLLPNPYLKGWLKLENGLEERDRDNISSIVADGNVVTTPADLATWAMNLYGGNNLLDAKVQSEMTAGIPTNEEHVSYGLGTELYPSDIGHGHNGAHPAYMTIMRYHPKTNGSYVLNCNFLNFSSPEEFSKQGEDMSQIVREAIHAVETTH